MRYYLFPYAKDKINALNTLFIGASHVLIMYSGTWQVDVVEMAKSFSSHYMVSHHGHRGVCSLHTPHQDKENFQSQTPASNINQPIPARSADQSMPCHGKRQTTKPRLVSQLIALYSSGRPGTASALILLLRVT